MRKWLWLFILTLAPASYAQINIPAPSYVRTLPATCGNSGSWVVISTGSYYVCHAGVPELVGGGGGGVVTSVSNSNGTLTISPASGAVIASLNLGNANTWTGAQTFNVPISVPYGSVSAPGMALDGSLNTGIFGTAGTIRFTVAGAESAIFSQIGATAVGFGISNTTDPLMGGYALGSFGVINWQATYPTKDIGLSRISPGVLGVGNGTQGDTSGSLALAKIILTGTAPTSSLGTVAAYSTNMGGEVTGLSAATTVTITFANGGWTNAAFCTATPSVTVATGVFNSSQSSTAVTFTFPAITGGLFYHCDGN
jgi:hypothetical protein